MRCGYTTGTCAALAAAGAVRLLLTGEAPAVLRVTTPKGWPVEIEPELCWMEADSARCCVRKDAGDDPDVTDGIRIFAMARKTVDGLLVEGGEGIGRVTKPGLDQPVGAAAINSVPRKMIRESVERVCSECGYPGGITVTIYAPEGTRVAEKTFNSQLGIRGGISILGTSGVVEPMSERSLVETTALEIRQAAAAGEKRLILLPGNYGMDYLTHHLPELAGVPRAKCSNYIGDAIDEAMVCGMEEILLIGHAGKLVKLAGGIMNTHSRTADCRRELFICHTALCGGSTELCRALLEQVTTDGCLEVLERAGLREKVMQSLLAAIQEKISRRGTAGRIGALLFTNERGILGMTGQAGRLLEKWRAEK